VILSHCGGGECFAGEWTCDGEERPHTVLIIFPELLMTVIVCSNGIFTFARDPVTALLPEANVSTE